MWVQNPSQDFFIVPYIIVTYACTFAATRRHSVPIICDKPPQVIKLPYLFTKLSVEHIGSSQAGGSSQMIGTPISFKMGMMTPHF